MGHERKDVGGGVQHHLTCERPARPEVLVPLVDILELVFERVDRRSVQLAQRVQGHAVHLMERLARHKLQDAMSCLKHKHKKTFSQSVQAYARRYQPFFFGNIYIVKVPNLAFFCLHIRTRSLPFSFPFFNRLKNPLFSSLSKDR